MKKIIFSVAMMGLLFASCGNKPTNENVQQDNAAPQSNTAVKTDTIALNKSQADTAEAGKEKEEEDEDGKDKD